MDAALAGLLGASVGAVSGVGGSVLTARLGQVQERATWRRTKTEESYTQCLRALYTVLDLRSALTAEGTAYLSQEDQPKYFAAIIDARYWLSLVVIFCGAAPRKALEPHEQALAAVVERVTQGKFGEPSLQDVAREVLNAVIDAARRDIGAELATTR